MEPVIIDSTVHYFLHMAV